MVRAIQFGGIYIPFLERADEKPVSKNDWKTTETLLKRECHNKHYFHNRPGGVPFWLEDDAIGKDATTYRPALEQLTQEAAKMTAHGNVKAIFKNLITYLLKNPLGKLEKLENHLVGKAQYLKITLEEDINGKISLIKRMF